MPGGGVSQRPDSEFVNTAEGIRSRCLQLTLDERHPTWCCSFAETGRKVVSRTYASGTRGAVATCQRLHGGLHPGLIAGITGSGMAIGYLLDAESAPP